MLNIILVLRGIIIFNSNKGQSEPRFDIINTTFLIFRNNTTNINLHYFILKQRWLRYEKIWM